MRSEPAIKQNAQNPVKLVVGKTFDELVEKSKKDVVLAFVGLSNQQTNAFELEFAKLAKHYNKRLEFAKMDMFKNDFPEWFAPSSHKPTLYYVPASDKSHPIEFKEETTLDNVKKFIEANFKKFNKNEEL